MKRKILTLLISLCVVFTSVTVVYGVTSLFFTKSKTTELSKKVIFQFDLSLDATSAEIGPGDSFSVNPTITNGATEQMYVFVEIRMPNFDNEWLYTYDVASEWIEVENTVNKLVYAYGTSDMQVLEPGDNTTALTEQMTMRSVSNAEYASIDDINVTFTGYAIGTEEVSTNPIDAWNECKVIGNIS